MKVKKGRKKTRLGQKGSHSLFGCGRGEIVGAMG